MKISLRLSFALLAGLPLVGFAQVPNGDLESWSTVPVGAISVEKPDNWDTPDVIAASIGVDDPVVEKESSIVEHGTFAAKLTSKSLTVLGTPLAIPGTLTTATLGFDFVSFTPSVTGGAAFTQRPTSFDFSYQYSPAGGAGNDTAVISLSLTKNHNPVGGGQFKTTAQDASYQNGTLDISYFTADDPDTLFIIITSSGGFTSVVPGSILYIDHMSFTGDVAINELPTGIAANVYPNPANTFININNPLNTNVDFVATNLQGQKMQVVTMTPGMNLISVSDFANGLYVFSLNDNGKPMYQGRFEVFK